MLKISEIPCLIIGYQRVEEVEIQIQKLSDFGINKIYVAIDGQKMGIAPKFTESSFQSIAKEKGILIETWIRKENLGLAVSVVTAIDWFFQNEAQGIILEDDLNFDKAFLEYVVWGLPMLETQPDCLMLSGNNFFPTEVSNSFYECSWSNYPLIWGWATSKDKWLILRELINQPFSWRNAKMKIKKKGFWLAGTLRAQHGLVDSWAIPLAANFYRQKYFCCLPPVALVENRGDDQYATHTKAIRKINVSPLKKIEYTLDHLNDQKRQLSKIQNELLERYIYRVRIKHAFSPIHVLLQILNTKKKSHYLAERILNTKIPS
jgi:hypothetical protein